MNFPVQVRIGNDVVPSNEGKNLPISINQYCGDVNGKTIRSVCCQMTGRFVTIQAKGTEETPLEIGKLTIKVAAPFCDDSENNKNLCTLFDEPDGFDENEFNDDRNDGSCIPTTTTTTTSTTSTSTTTTSTTTTFTTTTTICDPTPLRGQIGGIYDFLEDTTIHQSLGASASSWRLVRHVPEGNTWHTATDKLRGTDEYGDKDDSLQPFSIKWDTEDYNQVIHSLSSGTQRIITR